MDNRRLLVQRVSGGMSLSEACRLSGVTRKTGRKWVVRAGEVGIESLAELSRAPKSVFGKTDAGVQASLIQLREAYPQWGARKLVRLLWQEQGIVLAERTAEHILRRAGLTKLQSQVVPVQRFERDACGQMLQMDFKGLPQSVPYSILSVLDDHARFCFRFEPVPDKTRRSVQAVLWDLFGEHGLPWSMLMDNGDCWGSISKSLTKFEVWLLKLGVQPLHGRPGHPQTQGKVERFHGTAKRELGTELIQPTIQDAKRICQAFTHRYNWIRPHDALGGKTPGATYQPFERKRPDKLPEHHIPEGAITRKVDQDGYISFKSNFYRAGKGLIAERVILQEEDLGIRLYFMNQPILYLHEL